MTTSMQLGRSLVGLAFLSLSQVPFAQPTPITYQLAGNLEKGAIGSGVPLDFVSAIDPAVFGLWTGFLIYDVETAVFSRDITTTEGVGGKSYTGGITAIEIELSDGTAVTSTTGTVTVYTGAVSFLSAGYAVGSGFSIPASFWLSGTPAAHYASFASFLSFSVSGIEPATTVLGMPPTILDDAAHPFAAGRICGDFNGGGVSLSTECVELTSTISGSIDPVPEPATFSLLGMGVLALMGVATGARKRTEGHRKG